MTKLSSYISGSVKYRLAYGLQSIINVVREKNRSFNYIIIDINDFDSVIECLFHTLKPNFLFRLEIIHTFLNIIIHKNQNKHVMSGIDRCITNKN